ncbi:MAG: efflux RND transporter periplasmic adaptor subunit [Leptospirales bacterium]|nr:efflux RND transporter periplasmic adaptor subunit [Leptospirales bacterium]
MNLHLSNIRRNGGKPRRLWIIVFCISISIVGGGFYLNWRQQQREIASSGAQAEISHYTCPMHPQIRRSGPGSCPICGMPLTPVYLHQHSAANGAAASAAEPSDGSLRVNGVTISPERQQMIGVRTTPVHRARALVTVRASGLAAFDPELGVAIREYLSVAGDPALRSAAITRLKLLGMGQEEIRSLAARRAAYESLLAPGGNVRWVYASVYESEMSLIRPGQTTEVQAPYAPGLFLRGVVRSLSPTVDPMTRSVRVRIEVQPGELKLRPDSFITAVIRVDLGPQLLIPAEASLDTGVRQTVFVAQPSNRFELREVRLGPSVENELVVYDGLHEGEMVVSHGAFLIDAEGQLNSIYPTNAEGEVQHVH